MRVFDLIVRERRRMAELLRGLDSDQLRRPSLCGGWTVRDVAAHLTTYLRFGQAKIYLAIVATGADFDRWNVMLTRRAARASTSEIIAALAERAESRTTIPRSGYDPVLTDVVLHDLDIRLPLGIGRDVDEPHLRVAFRHLADRPSPGYAVGSRLHGLRLVAPDADWDHGTGRLVRGPAEQLLLAMAGRPSALSALDGDGVPLLRHRLHNTPRRGVLERCAAPLQVLLNPPPLERRSRQALVPDR
ncbi:maleylpyruvate isomerase family mycothiol-dependent enzyme [Micromonospora sp. NBC_01638]|uniref:maleylpyruvate isomerase family mycothiol-dependent enzyme n=1 Tax=Micromonospora sp. NBC_01638 TaxID=2975982 RepID=UPI00386FD239|nr:maleylpyruvate isomerase family mycothiol-dependent enzyme [Micromonospora sp. NBC_01638]